MDQSATFSSGEVKRQDRQIGFEPQKPPFRGKLASNRKNRRFAEDWLRIAKQALQGEIGFVSQES
jgi:hypothetical protein